MSVVPDGIDRHYFKKFIESQDKTIDNICNKRKDAIKITFWLLPISAFLGCVYVLIHIASDDVLIRLAVVGFFWFLLWVTYASYKIFWYMDRMCKTK